MKKWARSIGLGRLALYAWHRPRGLLRMSIAEGGPIEQWRTERGRLEMMEAAANFPQLIAPPETHQACVHFLTGRKYWYQTLFCFASLQMRVPFRVTPIAFDDGSIDESVAGLLKRAIPWVKIIPLAQIESALDRSLPVSKFPSLRTRRLVYPHLRKLIDLHIEQKDWGLVLDSDVLFHHEPSEIIDWFNNSYAMHMCDIADAYGYSKTLMTELTGGPVLPKVNVGLYAFNRDRIDWEHLEYACRQQLEVEGPSYLQEQGLTAIELTRQGSKALDPLRYLLMPNLSEGAEPAAVLHHYVAQSKRSYFQTSWRSVMGASTTELHEAAPVA